MPTFAFALVLLASCSATPSAPTRQPGVLSGIVLGHTSGSAHRSPLAGVDVSIFRQAVSSGGPVLQNPPLPVATVTTDHTGAFRFHRLPAGRWFVLAPHEAGPGRWAQFDPATGAVVTLVVCTDCPIPL
jgi:hypothetical protein